MSRFFNFIGRNKTSMTINLLSGLIILIVAWILEVAPRQIIITVFVTFVFAYIIFVLQSSLSNPVKQIGISGIWRNEKHFENDRGIRYGEYCRKILSDAPDGSFVKIIGIDCFEIFSDSMILTPHILEDTGGTRLLFKVILMDPDSPMAIEKRMWEMESKTSDGKPIYPEGSGGASLNRLQTKIASCVDIAKMFRDQRPNGFNLKLTPMIPCFSFIMTEKKVIGVKYSLSHKGKDTIIFEADLNPNFTVNTMRRDSHRRMDFYSYLEEYFTALWENPDWKYIYVSADKSKKKVRKQKNLS